ncbi:hypothetical protein B0H14DRAFT_3160794 [Mycena olivaceomarginata]|nr:hypothetical protein B0H14DRAFT_3160794 [Mycena olivaceomarginata]
MGSPSSPASWPAMLSGQLSLLLLFDMNAWKPADLVLCLKSSASTSPINFEWVQIETCCCMPVSILLVQNGVFPMSPNRPQTAVSVDLLDIYQALFERYLQNKGQLAKDSFRAGLQQAVQWYSNLRTEVQKRVNAALVEAETSLYPATPISTTECTPPTSNVPADQAADTSAAWLDVPQPQAEASISSPDLPHCAATNPLGLQIRVDGDDTGVLLLADVSDTSADVLDKPVPPSPSPSTLPEAVPIASMPHPPARRLKPNISRSGGDVQLGADGCFSYHHIRRAGDGPISYDPIVARKKKPAKLKSLIPQDVLDTCNNSFDAANEKKQKVDPKYHDASRVFVLACRHSQVLFLCNIDTPGEQQKYLVALLEEMNKLLPPAATILHTYDIGCYPILTEGLREHLSFALNVMHSFRHQWVCQLVYSPRFRRGMGLTDGEGVERLWSRIRKLIPITRHQWKDKNLPAKYKAATKVLRQCCVPINELCSQQEAQKAAQTSFRKYAPARMRCELDKVLALQTQIEAVEQSIHDAKKSLTGQTTVADSLVLLGGLEKTHAVLSEQADCLYSTLNIHKDAPELQGLPLAFVRILHAARDLKAHIQDRGQKSIDELLNLCQAVAGQKEPSEVVGQGQNFTKAPCGPFPVASLLLCDLLQNSMLIARNSRSFVCRGATLRSLRLYRQLLPNFVTLICVRTCTSPHQEKFHAEWMTQMSGMASAICTLLTGALRRKPDSSWTSMSTWLLKEQAIIAKAIESITGACCIIWVWAGAPFSNAATVCPSPEQRTQFKGQHSHWQIHPPSAILKRMHPSLHPQRWRGL